jgi:hypothetical protein
MRTIKILAALCLMTACVTAFAQDDKAHETIVLGGEIAPKDSTKTRRFKNHLIAPKGEWQCGLSVMYADFSSNNSDYMLLLQGLGANASMLRLAPQGAYTFADNHAVGARFQYTKINGMIDSATADLLGTLSLEVGGLNAVTRSVGGSVFQRTYVGLDNYGRVGIFWDYVFGYTRSKTQFYTGDASDAYSLNNKLSLNFAPGIVYFPMNNVSIQVCISMAGISYTNVRAYDNGYVAGNRHVWKARAGLSVLDLAFGLTVHL